MKRFRLGTGSAERTLFFRGVVLFMVVLLVVVMLQPSFVCAAEKNGTISSIADLDGRQLGVQTAVSYEQVIKDQIPEAEWNYFQMPNDMILALQSSKIDAYLIEEVGFAAQIFEHPELTRLEEAAGSIDFVISVGNNEKQAGLLAEVNEFIADASADGTIESMYNYWITNWNPNTCELQFPQVTAGDRGTIRVAVEGAYEPFSFVSNGVLSGFDIEFIYRFCAAYGYVPEFFEVPFDSISAGTEQGRYDFGMNIVLTDERLDGAVLSDIYYSCDIVFVLDGEQTSGAGFLQETKDSFYKTFVKEDRWKMFVEGTGVTILITLASVVLGTLLGFGVFILCRKSQNVAEPITQFISWLIHGMPTVLFLMILFYIIFGSSHLSGVWISVIGFTLIFACSMVDMLKVGFGAVSKGQTEASRAMGYSESQCFFQILLPQAARHFLSIYKNEVVTLIKETSIVGYIAVLDLTKISDLIRSRTYDAFFPLIATAMIYFLVETMMIVVVKRVQLGLDPRRRSEEKILKGIRQSGTN